MLTLRFYYVRGDPAALEIDDCLTAMIANDLSVEDMIDHMVRPSSSHTNTRTITWYILFRIKYVSL